MFTVEGILLPGSPQELSQLIHEYPSTDSLLEKLERDSPSISLLLAHMKIEGNEDLAARLLYRVSVADSEDPVIQKIESSLRNGELLNRSTDSDIFLDSPTPFPLNDSIEAHKSILVLESDYFKAMRSFNEFVEGKIKGQSNISPHVYDLMLQYFYHSDSKRKNFASTVDIADLVQLAVLSHQWDVQELTAQCDEQLCNSVASIKIFNSEINDWFELSYCLPKFTSFLKFVKRVKGKSDPDHIFQTLETSGGASELAAVCTKEEITLFSTFKTRFGIICKLPEGAFGKKEWEQHFPIQIDEEPVLPNEIHAILERKDPYEAGKKLKDTCILFLRPKNVTFHLDGFDKTINLDFEGLEELASSAVVPEKRTRYNTPILIKQRLKTLPAKVAEWVLIRRKFIPETKAQKFSFQRNMLKENLKVPNVMDVIFLTVICNVLGDKLPFDEYACSYTRCIEKIGNRQIMVGSTSESEVEILDGHTDSDNRGLMGIWST